MAKRQKMFLLLLLPKEWNRTKSLFLRNFCKPTLVGFFILVLDESFIFIYLLNNFSASIQNHLFTKRYSILKTINTVTLFALCCFSVTFAQVWDFHFDTSIIEDITFKNDYLWLIYWQFYKNLQQFFDIQMVLFGSLIWVAWFM